MDRETPVPRKCVEDTERAIMQERQVMRNAEKGGLTTRKPNKTFEKMLNALGESLGDLADSHNGEDGKDKEDDEEHIVQGKPSEDDEPSMVMGTIC